MTEQKQDRTARFYWPASWIDAVQSVIDRKFSDKFTTVRRPGEEGKVYLDVTLKDGAEPVAFYRLGGQIKHLMLQLTNLN